MNLLRIHAYQLWPQRTAKIRKPVVGGAYSITADIRTSLDDLFVKSGLIDEAVVDFRPTADGTTPHAVRQLIVDFTFGDDATAASSSKQLSDRLADSMDHRSPPSLLMLTSLEDLTRRRAILWAFPQESGFQLRRSGIRLLKDIFSHSSRLRKAAMFEGKNRPSDFRSGRIIDLQAEGRSGTGADYWVDSFLDCQLALSGVTGTRQLATYLRQAHQSLSDPEDKDQVLATIIALRTSPRKSWSYKKVAAQFLSGKAKDAFLTRVPDVETSLQFPFVQAEFESRLNFHVFKTENDILVSAPFGIDKSALTVSDTGERRIKVDDIVVDERVRARHAW